MDTSKILMQKDLLECIKNFNLRCLNRAAKWASELLMTISKGKNDTMGCFNPFSEMNIHQYSKYTLATSLYNTGEYKRAAHYLKDFDSGLGLFLRFYFEYKELQKKEWEDCCTEIENSMIPNPVLTKDFETLLEQVKSIEQPDSYVYYLQAIIYFRLKNETLGLENLRLAIAKDCLNWPAWVELAHHTTLENFDNVILQSPKIWMKDFYILEAEKKLGISKLTKQNWDNFNEIGLNNSIYLKSSMAVRLKSLNLIDRAKHALDEIFEIDPYNVDLIDIYSNILYLQQDSIQLSKLVRQSIKHARYRPETCYAIGNLYNLANLHSEAALYFQQSLLLNSSYTQAWTLLGHEFIELKNIPSAMASYKRAIELDPLEYRAWFGLGQVYELMKMPNQSLSLYKKAYYLRPCDSKLSLAISRILESLGNLTECIDMLGVSVESGDSEGASTIKLASLLESRNPDRSAVLYKRFLTIYDDKGIARAEDSSTATLFLMDYYLEKKQYDDAEIYARRGCRYNQSLKHSEMTLEKINSVISQGASAARKPPLIPTRAKLFMRKDGEKGSDSDMDMAMSP